MYSATLIDDLEERAYQLRRDILEMLTAAGSGHPGGSLSSVEILTTLFFHKMRYDPKNPNWEDRDRFILSKGHAAPVLYSALAESGYFPREDLWNLRKLGSHLQGHPDQRLTPGVEVSTGSLAQGFSFAQGMALAGKMDGASYQVYVLVGDGEIEEGQVWEAALFAAQHHLDNLTAFVDVNGVQNDGFTKNILSSEPVADKWRSFGWHVVEIDGHSIPALLEAIDETGQVRDQPSMIVCRTKKGKGVSFMENNPDWHGKAPNRDQLAQALAELESTRAGSEA
jgi:transketolase